MIYSQKSELCGCKIRQYAGGKVITKSCEDHSDKIEYFCPICKKKYQTERELKICRWSHAL